MSLRGKLHIVFDAIAAEPQPILGILLACNGTVPYAYISFGLPNIDLGILRKVKSFRHFVRKHCLGKHAYDRLMNITDKLTKSINLTNIALCRRYHYDIVLYRTSVVFGSRLSYKYILLIYFAVLCTVFEQRCE